MKRRGLLLGGLAAMAVIPAIIWAQGQAPAPQSRDRGARLRNGTRSRFR